MIRLPAPAVAAILRGAAERAGSQRTLDKAVRAGWSALHTDPDLMDAAFAAWCVAEDFQSHPSGLGWTLRRRYKSPADIAGSLRRAAGDPA